MDSVKESDTRLCVVKKQLHLSFSNRQLLVSAVQITQLHADANTTLHRDVDHWCEQLTLTGAVVNDVNIEHCWCSEVCVSMLAC